MTAVAHRLSAAAIVGALVLSPCAVFAQPTDRVALIIGNDSYSKAPLRNARNDARAMAAALKELGFDTHISLDLNLRDLNQQIDAFLTRVNRGAVVVVFYAGHGIQIDGDNYLIPVDFEADDDTEARYQSFSATRLHERVAGRGVSMQILILDACRDNPFRTSRSSTRGLAAMGSAQKGSLIAFSTAPGAVAADNPQGANSVFTAQLLEAIFEPGLTLEALFLRVRRNVNRITAGRQTPWTNSSLLEEFSFQPVGAGVAQTPVESREEVFWEIVNGTDSPELLKSYLSAYPKGRYASVVETKLAAVLAMRSTPQGASPLRPSITVERFRNLSGRTDLDWIGGAVAETLATELAVGESHQVMTAIARPGASDSRNLKPDVAVPASYRVSGSYVVIGDGRERRIRLNTLVTQTGRPQALGVTSDMGTESDLIDLIVRQGKRVQTVLGISVPSAYAGLTASGLAPASSESNHLYLEAGDRLRRFDALGASDLLVKLTTREPEFALGFAKLSEAWNLLGYDGQAREAATRARSLAISLPREQRLLVDAQYFAATADWAGAADIWRALVAFYPDNLDYSLKLAETLLTAGQPRAALDALEKLKRDMARAEADPRFVVARAQAVRALGDYSTARQLAATAADLSVAIGASQIAARAKLVEAWSWRGLNNLDRSSEADEEARRLFSIAGDRSGVAAALLQLGSDHRQKGDLEGAVRLFDEAVALSRATGDQSSLSSALNNLANVALTRRQFEDALRLYHESLAVFRRIQNKPGTAAALNNIATVLYEQGKPDEAIQFDTEALQLRREIGSPRPIAISLTNIAESTFDRAELQSAAVMYEEARTLFERINDRRMLALASHGLAVVRLWQGMTDDAIQAASQSLELRMALNDELAAAESRLLFAKVDVARGECQKAAETARSVRDSVSEKAEPRIDATALLIEALTCSGEVEAARREAETNIDAGTARVRFMSLLAITRLRIAEGAIPEAVRYAQEARTIADGHRSRWLTLLSDLAEFEVAIAANTAGSLRADELQQRAAAAGAGAVISQIQQKIAGRRLSGSAAK